MQYSGPAEDGGAAEVQASRPGDGADPFATAGRNDPCPCGSGRKFKRCHGDPRNA
jgi:preprotein translocase subunit SecA